jgi:hypothetical protein
MDDEKDKLRVQKLLDAQDPRVYAADLIKIAIGGYALASASTITKFENHKASFALPSHAALCLNLSNQAFEKAKVICKEELFQSKPHGHTAEEGLPLLFDLFEQLFLNVIFAYTALEAFANESIPGNYVFSQLRQDKKCWERYDRTQIERNVSLDIKLSEVLPEITGIKFQKNGSLWNKYIKLKTIRDRIIHVKAADTGLCGAQEKNIWTDLLEQRKEDASLVAHKIIQHFPQKNDPSSSPVAMGRNRWVSKFPFPKKGSTNNF